MSETFTRAELAGVMADAVDGLTHRGATTMIDNIITVMRETLSNGEQIKVSGFGNFVLQNKEARPGRNPRTGEPITISARRVLKFKPSNILREQLNRNLIGGGG